MITALNMNPDSIKYVVWVFKEGHPEMNIDGHELNYSQLGNTHHGLQCALSGDAEKHNLILKKCKQITKLFKEIDELNVSTKNVTE